MTSSYDIKTKSYKREVARRSDVSTQVLFKLEGSFNHFQYFCNLLWLSQGTLGFGGKGVKGI